MSHWNFRWHLKSNLTLPLEQCAAETNFTKPRACKPLPNIADQKIKISWLSYCNYLNHWKCLISNALFLPPHSFVRSAPEKGFCVPPSWDDKGDRRGPVQWQEKRFVLGCVIIMYVNFQQSGQEFELTQLSSDRHMLKQQFKHLPHDYSIDLSHLVAQHFQSKISMQP